jgi:chemotaxis regulatin CheY-phosphate phosphatase CheZ
MSTISERITETQRQILEHVVRCTTSSQRLVDRAKIILDFSKGIFKKRIARERSKDIDTVRKWCSRWDESFSNLSEKETSIAMAEDVAKAHREYRKRVISVLDDAP